MTLSVCLSVCLSLSLCASLSLCEAATLARAVKKLKILTDDVKDIKQELQHMYVCVPHVRKSTTQRDRRLFG